MQFRALSVMLAIAAMPAAGAASPALDRQFEQTVRPFVTKYCVGCHSGQMPAAQFDLKSYTSLGHGDRGFSALGACDGTTDGERDAAQADAASAGGSEPAGDRLDSGRSGGADEEVRGRSGRWCWRAG